MILDTSAVIAVLENEANKAEIEGIILRSKCVISAVSYLEASIVLLSRRGEEAMMNLDLWIESAGIEIVSFTPYQARLARNTYSRFGKGRHPASLNFGDCAAYGLVSDRGEELLYEGNDFSKTDVRRVPRA